MHTGYCVHAIQAFVRIQHYKVLLCVQSQAKRTTTVWLVFKLAWQQTLNRNFCESQTDALLFESDCSYDKAILF